jgi:protocatechuate 3,4-dioxygenase beta subunit
MLSASAHSKVFALTAGAAVMMLCSCRADKPVRMPVRDGAAADAQVVARAPVLLEGVVQDRRGTPLPDVLVIAWPKGKRGEAVAQARSGEDGRFVLPGLRPDRWKLLVEAGGIGTLETERQVPEDGKALLVVDGESRTVSGIVTDATGRPQAGADVTLGGAGLRWPRTAQSDVNGIFSVSGLGSGKLTVRATLGQRASEPAVVLLEETPLRPAHVRLSLQAGVFVEGRVVDDTGKPLAAATVDVMALPSDDLPISARSDANGRFRLGPVAPGKHQVLAHLEDYVILDAPEPTLGARRQESFELHLARTARLSGRVLDEAGRPMVGLQVSSICLIGGRDDLVVIPGPLPPAAEAAELPVGRLLRPGGVRTGATDKEGRFHLTGLAPGRTRVEILHPDKLALRREPLLLAPGDERDLGDLTMVAGATIAGKAIDPEGKTVEGALVEAKLTGRGARGAVRATTDPNGEFFLRVPLGEYALTAQTGKLASASPLAVRVSATPAPEGVVLSLVPRPPSRR